MQPTYMCRQFCESFVANGPVRELSFDNGPFRIETAAIASSQEFQTAYPGGMLRVMSETAGAFRRRQQLITAFRYRRMQTVCVVGRVSNQIATLRHLRQARHQSFGCQAGLV